MIFIFLPLCCHDNFYSQLCQNLTSEDVAKTFKTNKQMDKNAAKLEGERVLEQIADMRKNRPVNVRMIWKS